MVDFVSFCGRQKNSRFYFELIEEKILGCTHHFAVDEAIGQHHGSVVLIERQP